jgi:hypothetical protein
MPLFFPPEQTAPSAEEPAIFGLDMTLDLPYLSLSILLSGIRTFFSSLFRAPSTPSYLHLLFPALRGMA